MAIYDENDFDNEAECYEDQCKKEGFEDEEERSVTDQEWAEEKARQEEEKLLKEQEENWIELGFDEIIEGG